MADELINRPELDAQQRAVILALQKGCSRSASAEYAGVARNTFYVWLENLPIFASAVAMAEATAEVGHTEILVKAAMSGEWKASLEWLKRRRRKDWGDNVQQEVTGKDGGDISVRLRFEDLKDLDPRELARLHAETLGDPEADRDG